MTDETTTPEEDEDDGPDGFGILHDGQMAVDNGHATEAQPYLIGPFPPIPALAQLVVDDTTCSCRKTIVPIRFPNGIKLLVTDPDLASIVFEHMPGEAGEALKRAIAKVLIEHEHGHKALMN